MPSIREVEDFVNALCAEEKFNSDEGHWKFQSGGSCGRCTDSAMKVAKALRGRVVGYSALRNRSALVGMGFCEGHDFALIGGRFIVDYWAFRVARLIPKAVFDLNSREDRALATRFFGREKCWEDVPITGE
jgi:hypothetical protein